MGNEYIKKKTKFQQKKRQNFKTKKKKNHLIKIMKKTRLLSYFSRSISSSTKYYTPYGMLQFKPYHAFTLLYNDNVNAFI